MNTLPIDVVSLVAASLSILVVLIPVAGLTLRFSLKPLMALAAQLRAATQDSASNERIAMLERRVLELEQHLRSQSRAQLGAPTDVAVQAPAPARFIERY